MIELADVTFRYRERSAPALREVSVKFAARRHTSVVGPNGAGKTTLVKLLLGLLDPQVGQALFAGRPAASWRRREIAKRVGVVAEEELPGSPLTVREFVEMGRHPYLRAWESLGACDRGAVTKALSEADLADFHGRLVTELSGGERQRAKLARALAQEPEILLLDEPTAHLDVGHEMRIFRLVREFVRSGGSAITITHNLHLASRFADRIVLLDQGRLIGEGPPQDVLRPDVLSRVFSWPIEVVDMGKVGLSGLQLVPSDPDT